MEQLLINWHSDICCDVHHHDTPPLCRLSYSYQSPAFMIDKTVNIYLTVLLQHGMTRAVHKWSCSESWACRGALSYMADVFPVSIHSSRTFSQMRTGIFSVLFTDYIPILSTSRWLGMFASSCLNMAWEKRGRYVVLLWMWKPLVMFLSSPFFLPFSLDILIKIT